MTDAGFGYIFIIIFLVIIFAVIAVIGAVTGSIAGIVDDEDEMEEGAYKTAFFLQSFNIYCDCTADRAVLYLGHKLTDRSVKWDSTDKRRYYDFKV